MLANLDITNKNNNLYRKTQVDAVYYNLYRKTLSILNHMFADNVSLQLCFETEGQNDVQAILQNTPVTCVDAWVQVIW